MSNEEKNNEIIKAEALEERSKDSLKVDERYKIVREQIQHEDNLVNHRLTWLLGIEAFLFAVFTTLVTSQNLSNLQRWLPFFIALFGMAFSLLSIFSIKAAFNSLEILRNYWYKPPKKILKNDKRMHAWRRMQDKRSGYPPITYIGGKIAKAGSSAYGTPALIVFAWSVVLAAYIGTDFWKEPPATMPPAPTITNINVSSVASTPGPKSSTTERAQLGAPVSTNDTARAR